MSIVSDEKITELEYDKLSWYNQQKYLWCKKCYHFFRRDKLTGHICNQTKTYKARIEFTAFHPVGADMKSDAEYAEDIARLICDEITIAGGFAGYKILIDK